MMITRRVYVRVSLETLNDLVEIASENHRTLKEQASWFVEKAVSRYMSRKRVSQ